MAHNLIEGLRVVDMPRLPISDSWKNVSLEAVMLASREALLTRHHFCMQLSFLLGIELSFCGLSIVGFCETVLSCFQESFFESVCPFPNHEKYCKKADIFSW